jgi:hypothetical protein
MPMSVRGSQEAVRRVYVYTTKATASPRQRKVCIYTPLSLATVEESDLEPGSRRLSTAQFSFIG